MAVSTTRDCTWTIASDSSWLSLNGPNNGQGEAIVAFSIAPNPAPAARTGAIVVGSDRQTINQAGAPCRFGLSRTSGAIDAAGGALTVGVTTLTGCSWTATAGAAWITITSGRSGSASATVAMSIAANSGAARVGEANIAGQTYTVSQAAAATPPTGGSPGTGGGNTTPTLVTVTGSVSNISGTCPNLQFTVESASVTTTATTTFTGGACTDVQKKTDVAVTGTSTGASRIAAESVTILTGHGGH